MPTMVVGVAAMGLLAHTTFGHPSLVQPMHPPINALPQDVHRASLGQPSRTCGDREHTALVQRRHHVVSDQGILRQYGDRPDLCNTAQQPHTCPNETWKAVLCHPVPHVLSPYHNFHASSMRQPQPTHAIHFPYCMHLNEQLFRVMHAWMRCLA